MTASFLKMLKILPGVALSVMKPLLIEMAIKLGKGAIKTYVKYLEGRARAAVKSSDTELDDMALSVYFESKMQIMENLGVIESIARGKEPAKLAEYGKVTAQIGGGGNDIGDKKK